MDNAESALGEDEKCEPSVASHCTDLVSVRKGEEEEPEEAVDNLALFTDTDASPEDAAYVSKLEGLGPIILNTDGTMGRIPNWSEYTDTEKEQAIRLISARNKKRKEALLLAKQTAVLPTCEESDT